MIRTTLALFFATSAAADPMFENRSDALLPHSYTGGWEHFVGGGVAVFDCNGDRLPDIFAAGGESPAALMRNNGDFTFTAMPVPEITGATGAYPIDINGDDAMDLFVMRVGPNIVLQGGPDCRFTDATTAFGIPAGDGWTTAFTAWWQDDGRPVMVVGNYVDRANPAGPFEACDANVILQPVFGSGGTFSAPMTSGTPDESGVTPIIEGGAQIDVQGDPGYAATPLTPGFCPLSMLAARDARGRQTLRISNDRQYYVRGGYEQMWDIAEQRFLGPEDGWANVSLWGMGIASRDLNGDGRDEVMMTSMGDQLLQIAQPDGTYAAAPFTIGSYAHRPYTGGDGRPSTGWHAQFGDVDNDGRADLFIAKGNVDQMPGMATRDPNNLLMQQPDGTFVEKGDVAGIATFERSRGGALADFDLDGRLDLIVVNRRASLELYRNVTPDAGEWISVALHQDGGNRNAIGAVVTINGQSQQTVIGGGHASGQALPLHFGLGADVEAAISVTWPDGSVSEMTAAAGQAIDIQKAP